MVATSFDYVELNGSANRVKAGADRIKQLSAKADEYTKNAASCMVAIGKELTKIKEMIPYGSWGAWLKTEFGWSERTARTYMAVGEKGFTSATVAKLSPAVLQVLAPKDVPQEAIDRVVDLQDKGEKITKARAAEVVAEFKPVNRVAAALQAISEPAAEPLETPIAPVPVVVRQPEPEPEIETEAVMTEAERMQLILKLVNELTVDALGEVRRRVDEIHDMLSGQKQKKPESSSPAPVAAPTDGKLIPFDPTDMRPPEKFKGERFRSAWRKWCEFNTRQGKPLDEMVAEAQMKQLASRSLEAAIAAIDKAIADRSTTLPKSRDAAPAFKAPTVDEVRKYVTDCGFSTVDPERFVSYYETQGWRMANGNPMRDWKAAVRTWVGRRKEEAKVAAGTVSANDGAYKPYVPDRVRPNGLQSRPAASKAGVQLANNAVRRDG